MAARKFCLHLRPCSHQQKLESSEPQPTGGNASLSRHPGLQSLLMLVVLMATMVVFSAMTGCGTANSGSSSSSTNGTANGGTGTSNTPPPPPTFELITPTANETVKGTIEMAVNAQSIPGLDHIQFIMNGRILYNAGEPVTSVKPPYTFFWSSANYFDGNYTLQAVGLDVNGNVLKTSSVVNFAIANGSTTFSFTSPGLSSPSSGTVNLTGQTNLSTGQPAKIYNCFIDGRVLEFAFLPAPSFTLPLDTTQYPNGKHELLCGVSFEGAATTTLVSAQEVVDFENGNAPMELRTNFSELPMAIGDNVVLQVKLVNTDLSESAQAAASFASADSTIAAVASDGTVTAVATGLTTITATAAGKTRTVQVIVNSSHALPHFSASGQVLTSYAQGQSIFLRTLYQLDASTVAANPTILNNSGINALTSGFYFNAGDNPDNTTYAAWLPGTDNLLNQLSNTASANNLSLFLTGDDIDRSDAEMYDTITNPDSPAKLQHIFNWAKNSGRVVAVDMIDEADINWGATPVPTDGRWLALPKPIPDTAFTQLVNIIDAIPGHTPISYPVTGAAQATVAANWEGSVPFADFATIFNTHIQSYIPAYPYSYSIYQNLLDLDYIRLQRLPILQRDKPFLLLTSLSGPAYTKEGPGGQFTPGQDVLDNVGNSPELVGAEIMFAATKGFAGVRVYGYDSAVQKAERLSATVGQFGVQTFSDPTTVGVGRWNSMAGAFRLVGTLEPFLLQPPTNAEDLGTTIYTGARSGANGNLLIALNSLENPQTVHVDLSPYLFPNNCSLIQRYRLASGVVSNGPFTGTSDAPVFGPGESIAWVITKSPSCP